LNGSGLNVLSKIQEMALLIDRASVIAAVEADSDVDLRWHYWWLLVYGIIYNID